MDHRYGRVSWGPAGTRVRTSVENWRKPIRWNKDAEQKGIRYRVFCASLADVFEDWQGPVLMGGHPIMTESRVVKDGVKGDWQSRTATLDDMRADLFRLIDTTPNLDWLLLTKRPENIERMWPYAGVLKSENGSKIPASVGVGHCRPNVWLGTSVENQEQAEKRIPELLKCRDLAPVLFLSCEPMVGPVELRELRCGAEFDKTGLRFYDALDGHSFDYDDPKIDWVIAGGESGPNARPSHPDWFRSMRDQCAAAGVPFHFKQWGEWLEGINFGRDEGNYNETPIGTFPQSKHETHFWDDDDVQHEELVSVRVGVKAAGRLLDGVLHDAFPVTTVSS